MGGRLSGAVEREVTITSTVEALALAVTVILFFH